MKPARNADKRFLFKSLPGCSEEGCHASVWLGEQVPDEIVVAIMLHGGGFAMGNDSDVPEPEVEYLVGKGVVVVSLQYRLAPHVGFAEIVDDLVDGYRWVMTDLPKHLGVKAVARVSIMGWSAGALCSILAQHYGREAGLPAPSAVMVTYGLLDASLQFNLPRSVFGATWKPEEWTKMEELSAETCCVGIPHSWGPANMNSGRIAWLYEAIGGRSLVAQMYRSDPPFHETYDPIQLIDATHPPCFIVVATADTLVETAHSYNFHRKLLESGVVVELAEARNMEHGKSENNDSTEEASKAYAGWWEEAIKPGLDFVVQKMRA